MKKKNSLQIKFCIGNQNIIKCQNKTLSKNRGVYEAITKRTAEPERPMIEENISQQNFVSHDM